MDIIHDRYSPIGFYQSGGRVEREAAQAAVRQARENWLPTLEALLAAVPEDEWMLRFALESEIRRLRQKLSLPPPGPSAEAIECRRRHTRERVRRYRQRQRSTL